MQPAVTELQPVALLADPRLRFVLRSTGLALARSRLVADTPSTAAEKTRKIDIVVPTRVDGPPSKVDLEQELIDEICAMVDQTFVFHERE